MNERMWNLTLITMIGAWLVAGSGCSDPDDDPGDSDPRDADAADGDADGDADELDSDVGDGDVSDGDTVDSDISDADGTDGDPTDGDVVDADLEVDPVTETIGTEGGEIVLADGTTFRFPADALPRDTEITITPVEPEDSIWDDEGYIRIGPAFSIEPPMTYGNYVQIFIPTAGRLPEERTPDDVVLVAGTRGLVEGSLDEEGRIIGSSTDERIHSLWGADGSDGDDAIIETISAAEDGVYQPMVLGPLPEPEELKSRFVLGTQIGNSCSVALANLGLPAPPDIDDHVRLEAGFSLKVFRNWLALPPAKKAPFLTSVDRLIARTCYSIYRSKEYYREEMELPVPQTLVGVPFKTRVALAWEVRTTDAHRKCRRIPAWASGSGVTVFWNRNCEALYDGWSSKSIPAPRRPCRYCSGWNRPPDGAETIDNMVGTFEFTMAHEMFHWVEDWSNLRADDNIWGIESSVMLREAWAQMAAEECYDNVPYATSLPPQLWSKSYWQEDYDGHQFFRWLDWTQDDPARNHSVLKRLLKRVNDRAVADFPFPGEERITWDDFDEVLDDMYPSREDYGHNDALADFALSWLYLHDFERLTGGVPGDRYPDVTGGLFEETQEGSIWGTWKVAGVPGGLLTPDPLTVTDPNHAKQTPANRAAFTKRYTFDDIGPYQARAVTFDLSALDASSTESPVRLSLRAKKTGGGYVSHLALRMVRQEGDTYLGLWHRDSVPATETGATLVIPPTWFDDGEQVMVLTNVGDDEVDVELDVEDVDDVGLVLASFDGGVTGLDMDLPVTTAICAGELDTLALGDTYRSSVTRVLRPFEGYAISYPYGREIRFFGRSTCEHERSVDFFADGPGPVAMETVPFENRLVVASQDPTDPCAPGELSVVDLNDLTVIASVALPIGAGDMVLLEGFDGLEAVVTQPGHLTECFSSFLRSVVIDDLVEAGLGAPEEIVTNIPIGGSSVHLPTRMARTADRQWAAWTMRNENGRIGLINALDHSYVIFDPVDFVDHPWDRPEDVEIVENGDGLRIYFVYAWETIFHDDIFHLCLDAMEACSAARWLDYNPETEALVRSGERTLPYSLVNRIAVTNSNRLAYITHANRSAITVFDLGPGDFSNFTYHDTVDFLGAEPWPIEIWMPR